MVGAGIGAIVGLIEAFGEAESVLGYVGYILAGAFGGAILTALIIVAIPWAIGLGILVLILKACGVA